MWKANFNTEEIKFMEVVKLEYLVHTYIHNILPSHKVNKPERCLHKRTCGRRCRLTSRSFPDTKLINISMAKRSSK